MSCNGWKSQCLSFREGDNCGDDLKMQLCLAVGVPPLQEPPGAQPRRDSDSVLALSDRSQGLTLQGLGTALPQPMLPLHSCPGEAGPMPLTLPPALVSSRIITCDLSSERSPGSPCPSQAAHQSTLALELWLCSDDCAQSRTRDWSQHLPKVGRVS